MIPHELKDESGFVSMKRSQRNGWPIGDLQKVEILIGTGSHDKSKVGTLRFQVLPVQGLVLHGPGQGRLA